MCFQYIMTQKHFFKRFHLLLLIGIIATCLSCGKQDPCSGDGWEGTYNGTINCNGTSQGVTVIIEATASDSIRINFFATSFNTNYFDSFHIVDCAVNFSAKDGGGTFSLTANLEGDLLSLSEQINIGGNINSCQISATR